MRLLAPALVLAFSAFGCGNAKNNADAWTEEPVKETRPFREVQVLGQGAEAKPNDRPMSAWLGVRHDLGLAATQKTERCACLAAEVGTAGDSKFEWQGDVPTLGDDTEVIAISSAGIACTGGPADHGRASISAVDRENQDIVVEIEELREGRPLATGAVIPKPGPNGAVYVRPKNAKIFYARGTGAGGRCRVQ